MLIGIIIGTVTILECLLAISILERDEGEPIIGTSRISNEQWEQAFLAGLAMAFIRVLYTKAFWLAIICYIVMAIFNVVLARWWHKEGSDFFEMVPFVALALLFYYELGFIAKKIISVIGNEFVGSVLKTIPAIILVVVIGYFVVEVFMFRSEMEQKGEE